MKPALLLLLAALLAHPLTVLAADDDLAPAEHPLLERAREREVERANDPERVRQSIGSGALREALHQLQQARVPDE